jgi:hypothetical protein
MNFRLFLTHINRIQPWIRSFPNLHESIPKYFIITFI